MNTSTNNANCFFSALIFCHDYLELQQMNSLWDRMQYKRLQQQILVGSYL